MENYKNYSMFRPKITVPRVAITFVQAFSFRPEIIVIIIIVIIIIIIIIIIIMIIIIIIIIVDI